MTQPIRRTVTASAAVILALGVGSGVAAGQESAEEIIDRVQSQEEDDGTDETADADATGDDEGTRTAQEIIADANGDTADSADTDPMPATGQGPEAGFGGAAGDRTVPLATAALLLAVAGGASAASVTGRRATGRA